MKINVSRDEDYHSQRNNLEVPHSSCNTTAMVMYLKDRGLSWYSPSWMQPEDYLTCLLLSETARQELKGIDRYAYDQGIPPNQMHVMLALYANRLVGRDVVRFVERGTWALLEGELRAGRPAVVGTHLTPAGHVVEVVGMSCEDGCDVIDIVTIDDPYGDVRTGYQSDKGNNVELPYEQFARAWTGHIHIAA